LFFNLKIQATIRPDKVGLGCEQVKMCLSLDHIKKKKLLNWNKANQRYQKLNINPTAAIFNIDDDDDDEDKNIFKEENKNKSSLPKINSVDDKVVNKKAKNSMDDE
jgi:hypothetical protein